MLGRLLALFEGSRLLQLFLITACIQGGVVVSQFLVAPWVEPSVMGVIRSLETVLALVVLAGSLGMQSIAVRDTAEHDNFIHQTEVLRRVFILIGGTSVLVIGFIYVAHEFILSSAISSYVFMTSGLVLITNLLRASTAFAQGAKAIREIYFVLMLVTTCSVILHVLLTKYYGVQGWMVARYLGEAFCLLTVWWKLRLYISPALRGGTACDQKLISTARSGLTINAGLFARLLVDSLPVLMLTAFHVKTEDIGYFGIAILGLVLGLLPLAIVAQRALPDLVSVLNNKKQLCEAYRLFFRLMLKISSAVAFLLIVVSLGWLLLAREHYGPTAMYLVFLALSLPLKAIALSCGTMLVALRVFGLSLKVNMLEGGLVFTLLFFGIPLWGGWAGVLAYLAGSALSVGFLFFAVRIRLADL